MRARALAIGFAAALLAVACSKQEPAPSTSSADAIQAGMQREHLARGEYLAAAGSCLACHTVRGGKPYAGGLEMQTPFGTLHTPNITPDPDAGIGAWTADDFWHAMHEGRSRDGSFLYPAFPFTNYTKVTREDSDRIYAYLMSLPPVRQENRPHQLRFPYNQRTLLAPWRALYFRQGVYKEDPGQSEQWNRGAYLVEGLGHCNACHATRNVLGAIADEGYSGGLIPMQNWYAPPLASSHETGLGDRDVEEIVELLRTGVSARAAVSGPMSAVVQHSLQKMSHADLTAMAVYLKAQSEKPSPAPLTARGTYDTQAASLMKMGAAIYKDRCAGCHMSDGAGVARVYPPLANNPAVTMRNPVNAIRMVMNGGFPPSTEGNPRPYGMPPFHQELSDAQIAAVVTYIRRSWGNDAPPVTAIEVGRWRGVPVD